MSTWTKPVPRHSGVNAGQQVGLMDYFKAAVLPLVYPCRFVFPCHNSPSQSHTIYSNHTANVDRRKHTSGGWYLLLIYLLNNCLWSRLKQQLSARGWPCPRSPTPHVSQTPAADAEDVLMTISPFVRMQKHDKWSNTFSSDSKPCSVKDDVPF